MLPPLFSLQQPLFSLQQLADSNCDFHIRAPGPQFVRLTRVLHGYARSGTQDGAVPSRLSTTNGSQAPGRAQDTKPIPVVASYGPARRDTRPVPMVGSPARGSLRRPQRPPRADQGVESNARLTAMTAAVILVLLAIEGLTIVRIRSLLSLHVLVGMILIPPVALKIGSTGYRFVRYYLGSPAYRRKGPPPPLLRLLGPVLIVTMVALLASGVALLFVGPALRGDFLLLHQASFVLWFGAMTVHVLAHIVETARLAPRDWARRTAADVKGARLRQWVVGSSVALGIPLGLLVLSRASTWFGQPLPAR